MRTVLALVNGLRSRDTWFDAINVLINVNFNFRQSTLNLKKNFFFKWSLSKQNDVLDHSCGDLQ